MEGNNDENYDGQVEAKSITKKQQKERKKERIDNVHTLSVILYILNSEVKHKRQISKCKAMIL